MPLTIPLVAYRLQYSALQSVIYLLLFQHHPPILWPGGRGGCAGLLEEHGLCRSKEQIICHSSASTVQKEKALTWFTC